MGSGRTERSSSRRRPLITKRACVRLTLLLVAGAMLNIGVTFGALRAVGGKHAERAKIVSSNDEGLRRLVAAGWQASPVRNVEYAILFQTRHGLASTRQTYLENLGFPRAANGGIPFSSNSRSIHVGEITTSGWPWRVVTQTNVINEFNRFGVAVAKHRSQWEINWPGFAINTVFYAAILWLLFALGGTPFALRRRLRVKRGLCVKCAYDLRGDGRAPMSDVCPECGWGAAASGDRPGSPGSGNREEV